MAKYRRPIPTIQTFETISTIPAATSFQTIPPASEGVRKAIPIPAMITPQVELVPEVKDKDKEMIVQGVVIPPKPVPPKDDGTFPFLCW